MSFNDDLAHIYEREMRIFYNKNGKDVDFISFDDWLEEHGYK